MTRQLTLVLYVLAMIVLIVGLDVAVFRYRWPERLIANIGIILIFAAFYLRFFRSG